jgi:hypothetical protein
VAIVRALAYAVATAALRICIIETSRAVSAGHGRKIFAQVKPTPVAFNCFVTGKELLVGWGRSISGGGQLRSADWKAVQKGRPNMDVGGSALGWEAVESNWAAETMQLVV